MATTFLLLLDASGVPQPMVAEQNGSGEFSLHYVVEVAGQPASATNPLQVAANQGTGSSLAATVAISSSAGGTELFLADTTRTRYTIQNLDALIRIWGKWGSAASVGGANCFPLIAGQIIDRAGFGINQGALFLIAESGSPTVYFEKYW